ncbi:MAG TPA: flagellar motor switch protein FliN, partial [Candidatus Atribacteria bacterium]|nr:flagellar motor switch protein FliN [Candidatus Atribacteria bacterium]
LLLDVPLEVTVELGRTTMLLKDILELGTGSVIELEKLAGEPVEIMVNNKLIAKGEVVIIDENFGVRITKIISPEERVRAL